MYCKYCGAQLADGAKFCRNCGKPVPQQTGNQPKPQGTENPAVPPKEAGNPSFATKVPPTVQAESTGSRKLPAWAISLIIAGVAVAVIIVLFATGIIHPSSKDENIENLVDSEQSETADQEPDSGDVDTFDAFSGLAVEFTGAEPNGQVNFSYGGSEFETSDFSCEPENGLSNGDTVKISLSEDAVSKCKEKTGKAPEETEKEYIVKGLSSATASTGESSELQDQGNEDYLLPDSDKRLITEEDLQGFTAEQCKIARNELYARHGRRFKDEALQTYFDSKPWYNGTIDPDDFPESSLSDIEMKNRDTIVNYEKEQGYR